MRRNASRATKPLVSNWNAFILVVVVLCFWTFNVLPGSPRAEAEGAPGVFNSLHGLRVMGIVVEDLGREAEDEQITRRMLEDQALVSLRSKVPSLTIDPKARPYLYVNLSLLSSNLGYAGFLSLEVKRPAEILVGADRFGSIPTRRLATTTTVWNKGVLFQGPPGGAAQQVREILDRLMESLLAAYFRANP